MLRNWLNFAHGDRRTAIFAVTALVFVLAQGFAALHAAEFGDDHDHNGTACVVSVISKSGEKLISMAAITFAAVAVICRGAGAAVQTEPARARVRAARPRGPPNR